MRLRHPSVIASDRVADTGRVQAWTCGSLGRTYAAGPSAESSAGADLPMIVLWFWTYASSVLAHAVFLGLPASAVWGGVGMGLVVVPLAVRLGRSRATVPA